MSVLYQLEESQWWSPETMAAAQRRQLQNLLSHALRTIPFYRDRFTASGLRNDPRGLVERWQEVPILTREEVQEAGQALCSSAVPADHGKKVPLETSGSTGRPIRILTTAVTRLFWNAFTTRDHLWHRRDFSGKLVAIRPGPGATAMEGVSNATWGPPIDQLFATGPSALLNSRVPIDRQLQWVRAQQPTYLLGHGANIHALAEESLSQRMSLPGLCEVRNYGEVLREETRRLCKEAWNVPVVDMYTAQEVGYIALQCPACESYHVQSENLLVEVLNERGEPCRPREVGRIVLTTLHNFAYPLIRYAILDYAEPGESCPCGRGLPVINRVLGRERNMATFPDGGRFWPSFPAEAWAGIAPIRQIQLVQKTRDHIRVRYVLERRLAEKEQNALVKAMHASLGYPFEFSFSRCDGPIRRGENGKYEDFVSEIGPPG